MADPISLALGIAPLCLTAIKGFTVVRSKFHLFRNHKRELKRLKTTFVTQTHIFLDECHLLLQEVIDPDDVVFMVEDPESALWKAPGLDQKIKGYLGRKYSDVQEVIKDIKELVQDLGNDLNKISDESGRDLKLTNTERANEAFSVMRQKSSWESKLENIKGLNQELRRLRKMAAQVHQRRTTTHTSSRFRMPQTYKVIGEHARSLFNAIKSSWSCTNTLHLRHLLGLTLESLKGHDLQVLFSRQEAQAFESRSIYILMNTRPQRLPSRSRAEVRFKPPAPVPAEPERICDYAQQPNKLVKTNFGRIRPGLSPDVPLTLKSCSTGTSTTTETVVDPLSVSSLTTTDSTTLTYSSPVVDFLDLRKSPDVCGTFYDLVSTRRGLQCYIDTPDSLRHVFLSREVSASTMGTQTVPALNIFKRTLDADLPVPEQLRLVLQIAQSMLKLYATPWWKQYWSLSDLHYVEESGKVGDLLSCLRTLHVGTCLDFSSSMEKANAHKISTCEVASSQSPDPDPELDTAFETAKLQHGIRNLTLYSLGVALLQIGRWKAVESAEDVVAIRTLASKGNARLGPKYRELTLKCIECDFGQGSDLNSPQLQDAFYGSVICELERLICVLEAS
ncbi:hypothetical protein PG989_011866 [Apiospora arundinis]